MRTMTITTGLLAALLLLPASASAIVGQHGDYPAPTGSICKDDICFDIATAGRVKESIHISGDYEVVNRSYDRWLFNDIPAEDMETIAPMQHAIYNEIRLDGAITATQVSVTKPYNQSIAVFCNRFRDFTVEGNVGVDRTPDSIMAACEFTRRVSDPQPDATAPPTPPAVPSIAVPASAARCGSVTGADGKVVVRSSRHSCGVARTVVARYARSLRSPAGWSCTALVKDTGLRARCVRKAAGRAGVRSAVYGIWIRR